MSIGMSNLPTAFGCTVTKKIDRMFIQELQIGMNIRSIFLVTVQPNAVGRLLIPMLILLMTSVR